MDTRRLKYFVVAAEERNLRRAAGRLGLTQPAISAQLASLEEEIGADLFIRDPPRNLILTQAGEQLFFDAKRILSEIDRIAIRAQRIAEGKNGCIRIGFCEAIATYNLFALVNACRLSMPDMLIELQEQTPPALVASIRRGDLDLCVVPPPADVTGLEIALLWKEGWSAVLPKGHALADRDLIRCEDLIGVPVIIADPHFATGVHDEVLQAFEKAGIKPRIIARALHRSTLMMLATAEIGVTFVPTSLKSLNIAAFDMIPFDCEPMQVAAVFKDSGANGNALQALRIMELTIRGGRPSDGK